MSSNRSGAVVRAFPEESSAPFGRLEASIPSLRRYAAVLVRGKDEQDDLVHDCLVRALDRWHTRRDDTRLRAWLFAIMHNLFASRYRRRRARETAETFERHHNNDHHYPQGQEDHLAIREIAETLERLPEEQRSVLILVAVEDLSYAEAASVLDIPVGTVMSRLSRGRERLRAIMDGPPRSHWVRTK
jgi:RNA polymerase sigma factor (sigma-70 family)